MEVEEPAEEKVDGADSKEEGKEDDATSKKDDTPRTTISAEIQIYVHTLVLTTLMRHNMLDQVRLKLPPPAR
jgi:hypothetical protein